MGIENTLSDLYPALQISVVMVTPSTYLKSLEGGGDMYLPQPPLRAGWDTRSTFKQGTAGYEFRFFLLLH